MYHDSLIFFNELLYITQDGDDDIILLSSATDMKEDEKPPSTVGEPTSKLKAKIILDEAAAQREEIKRREVEAREKQRMEQEFMKKKKIDTTKKPYRPLTFSGTTVYV